MQILITLLLLIITSIGLFTFNYMLRRQNFVWLITFVGMIAVFVSILFWRGSLPITVELFSGSKFLTLLPTLEVTATSWAITLALFASTLSLFIAASSSGLRGSPFFYWIILNAFLIMSVLAINAGNIYVSILAFGALDALELLTLARSRTGVKHDHRFPIANFAIQTLGLFLIIIAGLIAGLNIPFSTLNDLPTSASTIIVLGMFFRVGILPTSTRTNEQQTIAVWHNNIDLYKFLALAVFASHLPSLSLNSAVSVIFQVIFAVFGVYSAWSWVTTRGSSGSLRHFIAAASSITIVDLLVNAQTSASAVVLFAIILTSLLNQPARRERVFLILLLVGSLLSLGLPFTYSSSIWQAAHTKSAFSLLLGVSHYFLVFGFIRHALEADEEPVLGLKSLTLISVGLLTILSILLGVWGWEGAARFGIIWIYLPLLLLYIVGLVAIIRFKQVLLVLTNIKMPFVGSGHTFISKAFARTSQSVEGMIQTLVFAFTNLSEGKGALLWTILILLIVLLSLQGGA